MASSPKKSRKRGLPDMIAHFPHNKPRRAEEMMIEEHKVDHEEKAYTVMNYVSGCILQCNELLIEMRTPCDEVTVKHQLVRQRIVRQSSKWEGKFPIQRMEMNMQSYW